MRQWIRYIRKQPTAYRKRAAFVGAVTITSVIAVFWFVSLPERFNEFTATTTEEESNQPAAARAGLDGVFTGVRDYVANLQTAAEALEDGEQSVATTTEATTTPAVVVPTVDEETKRTLNARPILIATTSATSS